MKKLKKNINNFDDERAENTKQKYVKKKRKGNRWDKEVSGG